jgi:hypothetical protein
MTYSKWILMAAFFSSTIAFADTDPLIGEGLLQNCIDAERALDGDRNVTHLQVQGATQCLNYINGVTDVVHLFPPKTDDGRQLVCFPKETVTTGQLARVVLKYLRDHPEELNQARIKLVLVALGKTWPCR